MDELLEFYGNKNKIALALGVSRQAVQAFFEQGSLPHKRAMQVERITKGRLIALDLVKD